MIWYDINTYIYLLYTHTCITPTVFQIKIVFINLINDNIRPLKAPVLRMTRKTEALTLCGH